MAPNAPVDLQVSHRDEGRHRTGQPHHRVSDFVGAAQASQGMAIGQFGFAALRFQARAD